MALDTVLFPPDAQDDFTVRMRNVHCFVGAKRLADGSYAGVQRLLFSMAICVGTTEGRAYTRRFCYDDAAVCVAEFEKIASIDSVPEDWIATRPPII
jgi:hypothetical protein